MKFGSREIANVVFRAKSKMTLGDKVFNPGQPVLYIDTATTSSMEQAVTTVYAKGGRSNSNLIAWDGDKTLTFTVEDALLSPIGLSILAGAKLLKGGSTDKVHVHTMSTGIVQKGSKNSLTVSLADAVKETESICGDAPIFVLGVDADGSLNGKSYYIEKLDVVNKKLIIKKEDEDDNKGNAAEDNANSATTREYPAEGDNVLVDYYILKASSGVNEIQIKPETLTSNFYVEADTLYRRQDTGVDMPAILTFPNVKIQSNFTISMAATGDPQTFSFVMDAFPDYTYFNKKDKVLCAIQIVEDVSAMEDDGKTVFGEVNKYAGAEDVTCHEWKPSGDSQVDTTIPDGKPDSVLKETSTGTGTGTGAGTPSN